jgi:hypothetical protein
MTEPTPAPATAPSPAPGPAPTAAPPTPVVTEPVFCDGRFAPKPSRGVIRGRTFLPVQLWRFAAINIRMLRVIFKSHD